LVPEQFKIGEVMPLSPRTIAFIDDQPHFNVVYLLKCKSDVFTAFKQFKAWAENITSERSLHENKGGNYMS
jgi:hypothetical protein